MAALAPVHPAARLEVIGGLNRPPMAESAAADLFALAQKVAAGIGVPVPVGVAVGGGSDGNFTAAIGVPTLDGLGVTGGGAHADHEFAETATMVDRTRLLTALIAAIRAELTRSPERSCTRVLRAAAPARHDSACTKHSA